MKRIACIALLGLVMASAAAAQTKEPQDVVREAREAFNQELLTCALAVDVLKTVAAQMGTLTGERWGVLVKTSGNFCVGADGGRYSSDRVCNAREHIDVLANSPTGPQAEKPNLPGSSDPTWINAEPMTGKTCAFVDPAPAPPDDEPCPACPEVQCPACPTCPPDQQAEVTDLRARLQAAEDANAALGAQNARQQQMLEGARCETANVIWRSLGIGCRLVWPKE